MSAKTINPPAVALRIATLDDAHTVERLVHLAYRGGVASVPWKNEHYLVQGPRIRLTELEALISSQTAMLLVAEMIKDGRADLIGCVLIENHLPEAHIGLLAVRPDCQNLGLGKMLIRTAEEQAKDQFKCRQAKMFVLSGRDKLLAWYKSLGYLETGETAPFPEEEAGVKALDPNAHFVVISKAISA